MQNRSSCSGQAVVVGGSFTLGGQQHGVVLGYHATGQLTCVIARCSAKQALGGDKESEGELARVTPTYRGKCVRSAAGLS